MILSVEVVHSDAVVYKVTTGIYEQERKINKTYPTTYTNCKSYFKQTHE